MELRPYQKEAVERIEGEWAAGRRSTLLVQATGTGKTIVMARVAEDVVRAGGRVLIIAHRGELLEQAADKLQRTTGLQCSIEKAEQTSVGSFERVTVGSVQTLCRDKRLRSLGHDRFTHIFIDEAHHAVSSTYRTVLDYFQKARVLGVTATADRADRRNLGEVFDSLAFQYDLPHAIRDGYLCPIKAQTVPLKIDLNSVEIRSGDFAADALGTALDPYLPAIADEMMSAGLVKRRTAVFLPLVATSKKFKAILESKGFRAAEVNGSSEDRARTLADFSAGRYDVICNSMLLTEGWDCPPVNCIVNLRATKSRSLYAQIVGRGTRLSPETGKTDLLLLDFLWMCERHELVRPAYLLTDNDAVAKRMTERAEEASGPVEINERLEQEAESDVIAQREDRLADELAAQRKKRGKLVDPLQFEMSILDEDLAGYVPAFGWEMAPPTEKQVAALERAGINGAAAGCAGKAKLILDRLAKRRDLGLTTPKQIRLLERYGFRLVGEWRFDDASRLIGMISENAWRVPYDIDPDTFKPEGNQG